jgi:pimeloyl-ACP methyl ester carboxylesterase
MTWREWLAGGQRASLDGRFHVFVRRVGEGAAGGHRRWVTFLHGFPTSSWDWARVVSRLPATAPLLLFDFLGFGDSDKPAGHDYSLFEQADITEALWERFGVERTGLVAHDYGDTVAQEILARAAEGRLRVALDAVLFLNGGIFPGLHQARPVQRWLQRPVVGPLIARLMSERSFARSFGAIFSRQHPLDRAEASQHWQAIRARGGRRVMHRLIRYIAERERHRERWERSLDRAGSPLRFVWGTQDPVSGAPMAARIKERLPGSRLRELGEVGHYPHIETPAVVAEEIASMMEQGCARLGSSG